jgi:hypothetical protein
MVVLIINGRPHHQWSSSSSMVVLIINGRPHHQWSSSSSIHINTFSFRRSALSWLMA